MFLIGQYKRLPRNRPSNRTFVDEILKAEEAHHSVLIDEPGIKDDERV
jgi:hypothetical protein